MHYNANTGGRPPMGRKIKRVSDVNAMGYTPYEQQTNLYPNVPPENAFQAGPIPPPQQPQPPPVQAPAYGAPQGGIYSPYPNVPPPNQFGGVFGQPIVQDMAMQYGQQLANTGKTMLKQEVEKIVPVTSLKYYFAVDTKYVVSKLILLFFPFTQSDWSLKYDRETPIQPRYDINAPDLYIPTMAYVTYVLVAGLVLGTQQRFSPEQIGILASSALAWGVVELTIYSATLYIANIRTSLRTFDLLAYSGYKFVGIIFSVLASLIGGKTGYYCCLAYVNFALAFFLIRTLKVQVLADSSPQPDTYYVGVQPTSGNKRRLYFLLFLAAVQPLLSWWLSYHLIGSSPVQKSTATDL